jgi:site-specific recombinase XerC
LTHGGRTLSDLHPELADFVAFLKLKNLSPRTIVEYQKVLKGVFEACGLGESAPSTITRAQLRRHFAQLLERGLSAKTVRDRIVVVRRFFGFLVQEGYLESDTSQGLPNPKVGRRLPKALSISQIRALLGAMDDSPLGRRDRMLYTLLYSSGLRVSEALALRQRDVDFSDGALRVVGKGDRERRVYLKPALVTALKNHISGQPSSELLFPGRNGRVMSQANAQQRIRIWARKAGIEAQVTPHVLRHSIAVHYLTAGAPITFVQDLLGHASLATTGIYTKLTDPLIKEFAVNTPTALDGDEGDHLKEAPDEYHLRSRAVDWDQFVSDVLDWPGR